MGKKILVVDNHPIVISGIISILKNLEAVVECLNPIDDITKMWDSINLYSPDILIMEMPMSNSKVIETVKEIKKQNKFIKILVFSSQYNNILALRSIRAGASGFLCKTMPLEIVKSAIERILKGGIYISDELNQQLNDNNSNLCEI